MPPELLHGGILPLEYPSRARFAALDTVIDLLIAASKAPSLTVL
jgi:hypothetical protein